MQYPIEQIKERFKNLPEDVKEAYTAVETTNVIISLQEKYKLHIDQSSILAEEVGMVMLGFTRPADFAPKLVTRLHITQFVANEIIKDINTKIFDPIKESLRQVHNQTPLENETTNTVQTPPEEKVRPTDQPSSNSIFDSKLKGLFTNQTPTDTNIEQGPTRPTTPDPYHEPVE